MRYRFRVEDAISRYRAASEAADAEALAGTLAPDVQLLSPISGRAVFRGSEDVQLLLGEVYRSLSGLRWFEQIGDGSRRVVLGHARIGVFNMDDAMVFDLDAEGRIARITPHMRPWLGLTALAVALLPRVGRHPALMLRALRRP